MYVLQNYEEMTINRNVHQGKILKGKWDRNTISRDFPGGPAVKTPHFQGTGVPNATWPKKKKKKYNFKKEKGCCKSSGC